MEFMAAEVIQLHYAVVILIPSVLLFVSHGNLVTITKKSSYAQNLILYCWYIYGTGSTECYIQLVKKSYKIQVKFLWDSGQLTINTLNMRIYSHVSDCIISI